MIPVIQEFKDELFALLFESLLNTDQKATHLDAIVKSFLLKLDCQGLEEMKKEIQSGFARKGGQA